MAKTLVLVIGSKHQAVSHPSTTLDWCQKTSILDKLPEGMRVTMRGKREEVRKLITEGDAVWCGLPLKDHPHNRELVPGRDFVEDADEPAEYLSAVLRHRGGLFEGWDDADRERLSNPPAHLRFVIVMGLYGLLTPAEHTQLCNSPDEIVQSATAIWTDGSFLTQALLAYRRRWPFDHVLDLMATDVRKALVDWDMLQNELGPEAVLHAHSVTFAGADALRPFGTFARSHLLNWPEDETDRVVFGNRGFTSDRDAVDIHFLTDPFPPSHMHREVPGSEEPHAAAPVPPSEAQDDYRGEWQLALAPSAYGEMAKLLRQNDRSLIRLVLHSVAEIVRNPTPPQRRGQVEKLKDGRGVWRYHVTKEFRIEYRPRDGIVELLYVGHHPKD